MYFGKTTKSDVVKYKGSGKYWLRHLNKHGCDVETLWISELFLDEELLIEFAEFFSEIFNIVESDKWANMKPENGLDGGRSPGFTGTANSKEARERTSLRMKANNPMNDPSVKAKHKAIMESELLSIKRSQLKKNNKNVRGKSWFNNGTVTKMFNPDEVPDGWVKGRLNPHWNNRK